MFILFSEEFHITLMPKTLFIYNRQHIKCKVVTDKTNYLVKLEFSSYKSNEIFLTTESSDFTIPDNMPIGIYKVTCLVSYMHLVHTKDQKYIILVKPTKLYISPTEIKLNERIHCYPYPDFVPTDVSEIKVIVNWTVEIDTDITEFFNFKPYVIEDTYLRIKEEGSFGVYEAYCKVIVHIFSHVYNLDGHFTFKVTGFSKPIIMEKQHKVPLFFFLYVTTMILISHYVVCYMTAFEKTLKRIHDMELLVILESIQVVQKEKMKKAYRKYNFSHDSLSKYIYNQISKIIIEKKRQFVNRVSKSLTFDHSILNSLAISSPKCITINNKLATDTIKQNLIFFIEGLSEGPFKYPKEPNAQNLYIILIKKILKDDTIQMNRLKRLKGDVEQKKSLLFPKSNQMYSSSFLSGFSSHRTASASLAGKKSTMRLSSLKKKMVNVGVQSKKSKLSKIGVAYDSSAPILF